MNDRELGQKLLHTGLLEADDGRAKMRAILDRDARRFRWVVRLTLALWAAVAILLAASIWFVSSFVWPRYWTWLREYGVSNPWTITMQDWSKTNIPLWVPIVSSGAPILAGVLALVLLVSLATIMLALAARRTTIRHVNANLGEISDELQRIRAVLEKPQGG